MTVQLPFDDVLTLFWAVACFYTRLRSKSCQLSIDDDKAAEFSAAADRLRPVVDALAKQIIAERLDRR